MDEVIAWFMLLLSAALAMFMIIGVVRWVNNMVNKHVAEQERQPKRDGRGRFRK